MYFCWAEIGEVPSTCKVGNVRIQIYFDVLSPGVGRRGERGEFNARNFEIGSEVLGCSERYFTRDGTFAQTLSFQMSVLLLHNVTKFVPAHRQHISHILRGW